MKNFNSSLPIAILAAMGLAGAHLGPVSPPKAGDIVKVGDMVTIKWTVPIKHAGIDVALSTDGKTWKNITTASLGTSATSFAWTVPNQASTTARIRVCQQNGGVCDDKNNVSGNSQDGYSAAGSGGQVYVIVTGNFTIQASTGVVPETPGLNVAPKLLLNPDTHNLDVTFSLDKGERVLLKAFDTRGTLVATLLDEARPEGLNHFSIFSNRLNALAGPLVFNLKIGDRVHAETISGLR